MILELKQTPNPLLKKKAEEVMKVDEEIKILVKDMLETMYANQGVGLAAPQVGVSKRVVVLDVGSGPKVFINPKILKKKGKEISEEGCLSVPGVFLKLKRAKEVIVEALDEEGNKFTVEAEGLLARCLQQEVDHLNGILILDRISLLEKLKRMIFRK